MRHARLWSSLLMCLLVMVVAGPAFAQDTTPEPNSTEQPTSTESPVLAPGGSLEAVTGAADAANEISTVEIPFTIEVAGQYGLVIERTVTRGEILQVAVETVRGERVLLRESFNPDRLADNFWLPGDYVLRMDVSGGQVPVRVTLETTDGAGLGSGITETVTLAVPQGGVATHEVTLAANTLLVVRAIALNVDVDPVLTLRDSEGAEVASNDDEGLDRDLMATVYDSVLFNVVVPADGRYTFEVGTFGGLDEGDVLLAISQYGQVDAAAPEVETREGSLVTNGQATQTLDVQAGEYLRISVIADDTNALDPILEVRNADGVLLVRNDDNPYTEAEGLADLDSQVVLFVTDDTTLSLLISAFSGEGGYTLRIERLGSYTPRAN